MMVTWNKPEFEKVAQKVFRDLRLLYVDTPEPSSYLMRKEELQFASGFIANFVKFHKDVVERVRIQLVRECLEDILKSSEKDFSTLLARLHSKQLGFLRLHRQSYTLLSRISISADRPITRKVFQGRCTITRSMPRSLSPLPNNYRFRSRSHWPPHFSFARIEVDSREEIGALDTALSELTIVRGIWNYLLTRSRLRVSGGFPFGSVNPILSAPLHVLYGRGLDENCGVWLDGPGIFTHVPAKTLPTDASWRRAAEYYLARVRSSDSKLHLPEIITRYTKALDEPNLSASYQMLWSSLEYLTHTHSSNYRHTDTVRRASFVISRHERAKRELEYLREWRNRIVHAGADTDSIENLVYRLKHYVDQLLTFLFHNAHLFENHDEFGRFLHLPVDLKVLDRQRRQRRLALRTLTP